MENKRINWIKIGIEVLAVFVFILLLVWLFPFGSKKPNNGASFGDNFNTLREGIRSYYDGKNLPEDTEKLTLQQLIDKKVVKKLYDKTGKACDANNSYTRITKINDNEYQLRIDLTCGNESDFVLETIKFEKDNNNTADNKNTNNTNNNNANTNNGNNSYNSNSIAKTKITQYRYYKKEIEKVTTYSCENGYILDGKNCVKTSENKVAAEKKYSEEKTLTMKATKKTGETKTTYADVIVTNGNPQYFCKQGTIGADNKCHVTESTYIPANSRLKGCNSGDSENGNVCVHHYSKDVGATTSEKVYGEYTYTGSIDVTSQKNSTDTTKYVPKGQYVANACTKPGCINVEVRYKYDVYTRSVTNKETCPNGGNPSGGRCYVDDTTTYNRETEYYCANGATPVNKQCPVNQEPYDPKVTYTKNYSCPKDYNSKGTGSAMVCYKTEKSNDTYYCSDSSYTLDKKTNTCTKKIAKQLVGYDCPSGYTLNGTMCYGNRETIPAKKWTVCTIITSYTWNSKTVLEGWTRTEETRVIEI